MSASKSPEKVVIGISSCLLGESVRYDGGHKFDHYINGTLREYFDFLPICPEVAIGLPVPRPPIQLLEKEGQIRVVGVEDKSTDVTEELHTYGRQVSEEQEVLCGYIFKSRSPSCGPAGVNVHNEREEPVKEGSGGYAHSLMKHLPLLPVLEEEQLGDAVLRDNFITRVFAYSRWKKLLNSDLSVVGLQAFHAAHKYLLMAHDPEAYEKMGRMLADLEADNVKVVACLYMEELMTALKRPASREQHVNVLHHLLGYLKKNLDSDEKAEMLEVIEYYRDGTVSLIAPLTLLKHHFRRHPSDYIERQVYLHPHPCELI